MTPAQARQTIVTEIRNEGGSASLDGNRIHVRSAKDGHVWDRADSWGEQRLRQYLTRFPGATVTWMSPGYSIVVIPDSRLVPVPVPSPPPAAEPRLVPVRLPPDAGFRTCADYPRMPDGGLVPICQTASVRGASEVSPQENAALEFALRLYDDGRYPLAHPQYDTEFLAKARSAAAVVIPCSDKDTMDTTAQQIIPWAQTSARKWGVQTYPIIDAPQKNKFAVVFTP